MADSAPAQPAHTKHHLLCYVSLLIMFYLNLYLGRFSYRFLRITKTVNTETPNGILSVYLPLDAKIVDSVVVFASIVVVDVVDLVVVSVEVFVSVVVVVDSVVTFFRKSYNLLLVYKIQILYRFFA